MKNKYKKLFIILLFLATLSLGGLISITFSWLDQNQHKTNVIHGEGIYYDITLIEDFLTPKKWTVNDEPIKKTIKVANHGADKTEVYIRLQLSEYLEIASLKKLYSEEKLLLNDQREIKTFASREEADNFKTKHKHEGEIVELSDKNGSTKYYLTDESGRKLIIDEIKGSFEPICKVSHNNESDQNKKENLVCDEYPVHYWDKNLIHTTNPFQEYVKWHLDDNVITLDEWEAAIENESIEDWPVNQWILDTRSDEGWVYWGAPLPSNRETKNFLKAVELVKQPSGELYYNIAINMQAVDKKDLSKWPDMPEKLIQAWS